MGIFGEKAFRDENCELCGTCLSSCPVMALPRETAISEFKKIREGKESKVLARCTTCFDCDFFCPNSCNPGSLFLERWSRIYAERGIPSRARYFLPHSKPNFRTYVIERMSPRERGIIRSWSDLTPQENVCYPGCNVIVTPLLTETSLLSDLEIRGALEYCCGEMYYRMGLFEQVSQVARKTEGFFKALGARKVTILCTAGLYMFTRVLPHFGANYEFEMESYLEHLKRKLDSGKVGIKNKLNLTVTVQDSCYGKQFGNDYMDIPRELLSRTGCRIVEMKHSRECMLCCGIGSGFSPYSAYNPLRLLSYTASVMKEAKKTGAEAIAVYCSGCLQMFWTCKTLYLTALPAFHIIELLQLAIGERPQDFHSSVGKTLLLGTLRHQTPSLLSRRRTLPPEILNY